MNKYAPVRKLTVCNTMSPWLDQELKTHMKERDRAIKSGGEQEWRMDNELRNFVTILNKNNNKMYYHKKISSISIESKAIWNILNQLNTIFLGGRWKLNNYLSGYSSDKIQKLNNGMKVSDRGLELSSRLITNKLMKNKCCSFH